MNRAQTKLTQGIDWPIVGLYLALVTIGILSIFAAEYRGEGNILGDIIHPTKNYSRQVIWFGVSLVLAAIIWLTDSKFFTATANLAYAGGLLLLLLVLGIGKDVKGSHSWLVIGGFQFQPAELTKLCTNLALAKYLSSQETDFTKLRSRLIAAAIALIPSAIIILQDETGLALVYFSFFLVMYREGLPGILLVIAFSGIVLVLSALLVDKIVLFAIFTVITALVIYFSRREIKRKRSRLAIILGVYAFCSFFVMFVVPFAFTKVLKDYQVRRIEVMLGKENDPKATYNTRQSMIAIGSGGVWGKGYLKGTQTRYDFVPEQSTDFIFCTIGEDFGFAGSIIFLAIYVALLFRIIFVAERQRSTFTRVYAYGVASIIFFHLAINISMTIGLAPVIGIPLPLVSYGGSSLMTFTMLIFILLRLDADRQMVLR
ncbi:rod shape determining protein RodA [Chitinophaga terrae (ex Kim and Jung 2007)]|uniref:Cell wall polymerase n=1 Tax=Chitinophaga terrae (ex Kim and Jung 2007) TaxID=408074 RepID=A0A1H4CU42_9BACT|nr:rod shape-determining protein RodA [Chitinophaga terrae (ex Kim and Jung 2007)]MDQ0105268.1 rod shape determining protein RodA [Chitinophaga terrae (ex Kim and Jung 2007)]GEP90451.1 rod shape-determining protein RodA [Chitinophaga terrae (ex Kim and Jung 2007)]SEA63612.1 rod shape determining protein RodA [Chitinophaga terrae (ex Kim and Jung 2007)]